jgi:hypothetical protein
MGCHVLKANGIILQHSMVGHLTPAKLSSEVVKRAMADFMTVIYDGPLRPASTDGNFSGDSKSSTPSYNSYGDKLGDEPKMPEANMFMVNAYDKYIGAQLWMPIKPRW